MGFCEQKHPYIHNPKYTSFFANCKRVCVHRALPCAGTPTCNRAEMAESTVVAPTVGAAGRCSLPQPQ